MNNSNSGKQINPLQSLYTDVKKLLEQVEFKNQELADSSETETSKESAELWLAANQQRDNFNTYKNWWSLKMFRELDNSITDTQFKYYLDHPFEVPFEYREYIRNASREAYLIFYEEYNSYYRMLNGMPPYGETEFVYMSDELAAKYDDQYIDMGYVSEFKTPVHLLPNYIQTTWMSTDDYSEKVALNPDKGYLKYIGSNQISIYTARLAKDFDIIRYPNNDPNINPNLLKVFSELYEAYREYVMVVLYNRHFAESIVNYRNFLGHLIIVCVLMHIGTKGVEATIDMNFIDDTVLHTVMEMYNIDDNLLLNKDVKRNLVRSIPRLTREKGTNEVYYDIVDILGYDDVVIRKLMLMHGPNWNDTYKDTGDKDTSTYFLGIDLKDEDPYRTIVNGAATKYPYRHILTDGVITEEGIAQGDPRWWVDDETVRNIVENGNYTMMDTKYITIESTIHQMEYIFEIIYFLRIIFDNKSVTENISFSVPGVFDKPITLFDTALTIVAIMVKLNGDPSDGIMKNTCDLLAIAGFNFGLDKVAFDQAVAKMEYVDADRLDVYLKDIQINTVDDIGGMYNNIIYPLRIWLENKIAAAETRAEYIEYESIYKALYTYDIRQTTWLDDFKSPLEVIASEHSLTEDEINALIAFYGYSRDSLLVTDTDKIPTIITNQDEYVYRIPITNDSNGVTNAEYAFCNLSLYDILTAPDLKTFTINTESGEQVPVFMSASEGQYVVNESIVNYVIKEIENLKDDALAEATFHTEEIINGTTYRIGSLLPKNIRISGIYKEILISKIKMDMKGLAVNADTFEELLRRRTEADGTLYDLYNSASCDDMNKNGWIDKMMNIVITMENLLGVNLQYIEQMLLGDEQFFEPLISLINRFKSIYIDIAKTGLKYAMDDKMDIGGNSNMFKLFDEMDVLIHFTTISNAGYNSEFGFYDVIRSIKYRWIINDIASFVRYTSGEGFAAIERNELMGSMRMSDEARFFLNGKDVDPTDGSYPQYSSYWHPGEYGSGRWTDEDDFLMKVRESNQRVKLGYEWDLDGWKEYVESYNDYE